MTTIETRSFEWVERELAEIRKEVRRLAEARAVEPSRPFIERHFGLALFAAAFTGAAIAAAGLAFAKWVL